MIHQNNWSDCIRCRTGAACDQPNIFIEVQEIEDRKLLVTSTNLLPKPGYWQNELFFSGDQSIHRVEDIWFEDCFSEACLSASVSSENEDILEAYRVRGNMTISDNSSSTNNTRKNYDFSINGHEPQWSVCEVGNSGF